MPSELATLIPMGRAWITLVTVFFSLGIGAGIGVALGARPAGDGGRAVGSEATAALAMPARPSSAVGPLKAGLCQPAATPLGPCHTNCYRKKTRAYQRCRAISPTNRAQRSACFRAADEGLTRCLEGCR